MKALGKSGLYILKLAVKRTQHHAVTTHNIYLSSVSFESEYIFVKNYVFAAFVFGDKKLFPLRALT